ncbi:MAG: hypothetical protein GXP34_05640 [Actinobacteria bacterium]|nr:hypothetical protein [Actinomycetota bacterium]
MTVSPGTWTVTVTVSGVTSPDVPHATAIIENTTNISSALLNRFIVTSS